MQHVYASTSIHNLWRVLGILARTKLGGRFNYVTAVIARFQTWAQTASSAISSASIRFSPSAFLHRLSTSAYISFISDFASSFFFSLQPLQFLLQKMYPADGIRSQLEWNSTLSTTNAPVPTEKTKFLRKVATFSKF